MLQKVSILFFYITYTSAVVFRKRCTYLTFFVAGMWFTTGEELEIKSVIWLFGVYFCIIFEKMHPIIFLDVFFNDRNIINLWYNMI